MRHHLSYLFMFLFIVPGNLISQQNTFSAHYKDKFLYLHALSNYAYHPYWDNQWEENLFSKTGLRMSYGSVEVNDLMVNQELVLNRELKSGFWLGVHFKNYQGQERENEKYLKFTMEKQIYKKVHFFVEADPAFDKEEIDGGLGLALYSKNRIYYFRFTYYLDDFLYESKNDLGGKVKQNSAGLKWQIRFNEFGWTFFSTGKLGIPFNYYYPNIEKSAGLLNQEGNCRQFHFKLYTTLNRFYIESALHFYGFEESKNHSDSISNYSFERMIWIPEFRTIYDFSKYQSIRFSLRFVNHKSEMINNEPYKYNRKEWLPSVFYQYNFKNAQIELAYLTSIYKWEYKNVNPFENYSTNDVIEKVKLGWTYQFTEQSKIQLSVSHVISFWGFGGGNLQFITNF